MTPIQRVTGTPTGFARASTRESCQPCHAAQGVLPAWGENAEYVEKDGDPLPQVCVVCHDPHAATKATDLFLRDRMAESGVTGPAFRDPRKRNEPAPAEADAK